MFVFRFFISHPITSAHFRISGPEIASSEVGSIEYFLYPQKHTRLRAMKFAISRNPRNQYNWSQSVANRRSTQWLSETKTSQSFESVIVRVINHKYLLDNYDNIRGERSFPATRKRIYRTHQSNRRGQGGCSGRDFLLGGLEPFITWNTFCPSGVDLLHLRSFSNGKWPKGPKNSSRRPMKIVLRFKHTDKVHSFGLS